MRKILFVVCLALGLYPGFTRSAMDGVIGVSFWMIIYFVISAFLPGTPRWQGNVVFVLICLAVTSCGVLSYLGGT